MSVNKTPDSLFKSIKTFSDVPKPADNQPDSLQNERGELLPINLLAQPEAPVELIDSITTIRVKNLLKDTSRSTFDKLKNLLPIPDSLAPIINMFFSKKTKAGVEVSIENNSFNLTAELKMPGQGTKFTAILSVPMTAQSKKESVTELHPAITGLLSKIPLVAEEQDLIKLISTLPSEMMSFVWSNGYAGIGVTLPNGATLNLKLKMPTSEESAKTPDVLRAFLKSILKENYASIETLLNKDMIFNWDGSTSRFEIRFPQQLAIHIKNISLNISNGWIRKIVEGFNIDSTIIIPSTIRGKIDFKNPSIQFDEGTTFIGKRAPDITIDRISYNPDTEKMFLTLKHPLIPDTFLKDMEFDMKEKPLEKDAVERPNIVKFECIPIDTKKNTPIPEVPVAKTQKETVSVFESLKQIIKIPEALKPVLDICLADQTKIDVSVGIEDNLTVSVNNLNIPRLGISGKASLSIPTQVQAEAEAMPVKLHPTIDSQLAKLLTQELKPLEETTLLTNLIDLALRMPNQDMYVMWEGGMGLAQLVITLPGGMVLKLELDVQERDILRTKLTEILGSQFAADFEPLLNQTFNFNWNGATKEFSLKFLQQQKLAIKSVKLKKGGFFQNMLRKFVSWITRNRVITLPKEIHGKVNFETASVEFQKGTSFTVHTALGLSKKLGLRLLSFARDNMIDIGFRCFGSQAIEIDTRTSNVETARLAILEDTALVKQVQRNRE